MAEPVVIAKDESTTLYNVRRGEGVHSLELYSNNDLSQLAKVEIFGPELRYGSLAPAEVNWSAHGSVSPAEALRYARMIELAAKIAEGLNAQMGAEGGEEQ